jgi:hypothetical protein
MKELVEYIAKSLVNDPSQVEVNIRPDRKNVIIELKVAEEDTGRIIGKEGRVANAIRALVRSMAARDGKRVTLKIL